MLVCGGGRWWGWLQCGRWDKGRCEEGVLSREPNLYRFCLGHVPVAFVQCSSGTSRASGVSRTMFGRSTNPYEPAQRCACAAPSCGRPLPKKRIGSNPKAEREERSGQLGHQEAFGRGGGRRAFLPESRRRKRRPPKSMKARMNPATVWLIVQRYRESAQPSNSGRVEASPEDFR